MREPYVLHLPKWYPHRGDPLDGIFVKRHITCAHREIPAMVIYLRSEPLPGALLWKSEWEQGDEDTPIVTLRVYYRKHLSGFSFPDRLLKLLLYYLLLFTYGVKVIIKRGRPCMVVVHVLLRSALLAATLRLICRIPFVVVEHNTRFLSKMSGWHDRVGLPLIKMILRSASAVITVSQDLGLAMRQNGLVHRNYLRIFNSVDTTIFHPADPAPASTEKFIVLHVSEFKNDHKNITGLIDAFSIASGWAENMELHLVGYGRDEDLVSQKIAESTAASKIIMIGTLTGPTLAQAYCNAKLFVLFSNRENMPCVIAESLCCGTPVLSTRVGGVGEVIHPGNGMTVGINAVGELAKVMADCANGKIRFDRNAIADEAAQRFSDRAIGEEWVNLYRRLGSW
ncbi:MAG: glycosyltransferase [Saprospiraceae bacterium]|nr:glycosyltransferase [Saprospiraceae bacterium]MBP9209677.1 glycosyltransferase [Saprospiraceae bacterium]